MIEPFVEEYLAGRTPIPCTLCNNFIKFDQFLEMADAVGAGRSPPGIMRASALTRRRAVSVAQGRGRDQGPDVLPVRPDTGATGAQLVSAGRDAQVRSASTGAGHATVGGGQGRKLRDLLRTRTAIMPRSWTLICGRRACRRSLREGRSSLPMGGRWGEHEGVHHFTVGQRKGLGIATGEPLYVIATDPQSQRVTVGRNDELLRARPDRPRRELDFDRRVCRRRCAQR